MTLYEKLKGRLASILSPHFLGREQEALVNLSEAVLEEADSNAQERDQGLQEQINNLHTEQGAGLIGIEDAGGFFASFTVEGALQELGAGGGGGGGFNPSLPRTITGKWKFTQPVAISDGGFEGNISAPVLSANRTYVLPDKSGTLATLDDISGAGNIIAGDGIDVSTGPEGITITNTIPQINLIPGSNVGITGTYPNITISAAGGSGGGGAVNSVNGKVGDVIITNTDVGAAPTNHTHSISQVTGLQPALDGKANALHTHPTAAITSGVFPPERLGTGPASSDTFLRGDGIWAVPSGAGPGVGTVTSVNVQGGTGLSFTGGPITSSGTITGSLSTNLQSWSGINPSTKANTGSVVNTTGHQIGIAGNKAWTGFHTFEGDIHVGKASASVTVGLTPSAVSGGIANYGNPGQGDVGLYSEYSNGTIRLRPDGRGSATGQLLVNNSGISWNGHTIYHTGNPPPTGSGTVTQVTGGNGLTGSVTTSGSISLGTPGTLSGSTTNSVTSTSHTHALSSNLSAWDGHHPSSYNIPTQSADIVVAKSSAVVGVGTAGINGGLTNYGNTGTGEVGIFSNYSGGTIFLRPNGRTSSTGQAYLSSSGVLTATNHVATSDARLKEGVKESRARKELLTALRHYRWKWKGQEDGGLGVLAQEVERVAPEYIYKDEAGLMSVDKAGLALEMVFALIDRLEELENGSAK